MNSTVIAFTTACLLTSAITWADELVIEKPANEQPVDVKPVEIPTVEKDPKQETLIATQIFFREFDKNRDGLVSTQEAHLSPALVKSFNSIDNNRDGLITVDEFSALFASQYRQPKENLHHIAQPKKLALFSSLVL